MEEGFQVPVGGLGAVWARNSMSLAIWRMIWKGRLWPEDAHSRAIKNSSRKEPFLSGCEVRLLFTVCKRKRQKQGDHSGRYSSQSGPFISKVMSLLFSKTSTGFHFTKRKTQRLYNTENALWDLTCPHPSCLTDLIYSTLPLAYLALSTLASLVAPQTDQAPSRPRDLWTHSFLCLEPPYLRYPCSVFPHTFSSNIIFSVKLSVTPLFEIFLSFPCFVCLHRYHYHLT